MNHFVLKHSPVARREDEVDSLVGIVHWESRFADQLACKLVRSPQPLYRFRIGSDIEITGHDGTNRTGILKQLIHLR